MEYNYLYIRISTKKQSKDRQIANLTQACKNPTRIFEEIYTGKEFAGRKKWNELEKLAKAQAAAGNHVTIWFDEVSRMSRNSEEGIRTYMDLYNAGIDLVFLKEPHINTSTYRDALKTQVSMTGDTVDLILEGVNKYLIELAKKQIELAFARSQEEVDYLHKRTSEGLKAAKARGKVIGRPTGKKITTKKETECKKKILEKSRDFNGTVEDLILIESCHISRNTFYKYKRELREDFKSGTDPLG